MNDKDKWVGSWTNHIPTCEEIREAEEPARAKTIAELRSLSDEQLIAFHDWLADSSGTTADGTSYENKSYIDVEYYLNELMRRENTRLDRQIAVYTKHVTVLTWIITFLTLVNVVAAIIAITQH